MGLFSIYKHFKISAKQVIEQALFFFNNFVMPANLQELNFK